LVTTASEATDQASLQLFGWWQLRRRGDSIQVGTREQRLMALLALVGRRTRAHLAGTLWPDSDEHRAMASLRAAVWQVRRCAPNLLDAQQHTLALDDGVRTDVAAMVRLMAAVAASPLAFDERETIETLTGGELLPGWYDDWVLFERERLDHLRIHALDALGRAALQAGHPEDCELAARAGLRIEPLHEGMNILLVQAFLSAGSPVDAVRQFELYRRRLAQELGIRPSGRLMEIVRPMLVPVQRSRQPRPR
jgi:DNA-binding SARP family transcriptional activator